METNAPAVAWHALEPQQVADRLGSNSEHGLRTSAAAERLAAEGGNRLVAAERPTALHVFLRQILDPLVLLLLVAAAVSLAIGHTADSVTILAIVLLNAVLGFTQEWRAERALEGLRRLLALRCRVVRDGTVEEIDAESLVRGDLVLLKLGDRVPADLRLLGQSDLGMDEASLTGESEAVGKTPPTLPEATEPYARANIAWMGTTVVRGRGMGLVVATGMHTMFGHVAGLAQELGSETTPLQRTLAALGKRIGMLGVGVSALVALAGVVLGRDLLEMFFIAVSLAVAVVPEGLPAVVTVTLALGVRTMVKRRVLLRRLSAAESLGAATVVCTDKTGTLTRGEMTVQRIWTADRSYTATGSGYDPAGQVDADDANGAPAGDEGLRTLLESGLLCNHAEITRDEAGWHLVGEPTEGALVVAAMKADVERPVHTPEGELPFDSVRKRMTVVEQRAGLRRAHVKGAPEVVLKRCAFLHTAAGPLSLGAAERARVDEAYHALAGQGLRVLALARRTLEEERLDEASVERGLTLLGLVGLLDPARVEVPDAIARAYAAGIRVIVITGDAPETALAVCRQIGLPAQRAVVGAELETWADDALVSALGGEVVFARTTPRHKLRIVKALQAGGEIVGMTGDGVNDAPALKQADVGMAMGIRGTDASKGASDMILMDDNFATIINGVEEGRRQFDNIRKFVRYLLSSNTGEVVAIFVSILIGGPLLLLPVQILWTNLVTDGLSAVALGLEPAGRDIMQRRPRDPRVPLVDRRGWWSILLVGSYIGAVTLFLYYVYGASLGTDHARTLAFTGLVFAEKVNVMNFRSLQAPLSAIGFFANPYLLVAIALSLGMQVAAVYAPALQTLLHTVALDPQDWGVILALALPILLVGEAYKRMIGRGRTEPSGAVGS